MIKNLRKKFKNKKGFTMVELIVVIVIILVLAAVLVPQLLKYVDKANEANCKADAATAMVQVQSDLAAMEAGDVTGIGEIDLPGVAVDDEYVEAPEDKNATYTLADGVITQFSYGSRTHYAVWQNTGTDAGEWVIHKRP